MNHSEPWNRLRHAAMAVTMAPVCASCPIWLFLCGMVLLCALVAAIFWCFHTIRSKARGRHCPEEILPSKAPAPNAALQVSGAEDETTETLLLRHVNHRISAYLKTAWPGAKWEWCTDKPEALALTGGIGRIRIWEIPDFAYADILMDRQANITCELIKIFPPGARAPENPQQKEASSDKGTPNPQVWYELQGRKVLEPLVTDLNSRGFHQLTLCEDGTAYAEEGKKKVTKGHFDHFPKKPAWTGLVQVLESNGLAARITANGILISW